MRATARFPSAVSRYAALPVDRGLEPRSAVEHPASHDATDDAPAVHGEGEIHQPVEPGHVQPEALFALETVGIDQRQAAHAVGVPHRAMHRDLSAEGMADEIDGLRPEGLADGLDELRHARDRVVHVGLVRPAAAREVEGHPAAFVADALEQRAEVRGAARPAVHEEHDGQVGAPGRGVEHVDADAVHVEEPGGELGRGTGKGGEQCDNQREGGRREGTARVLLLHEAGTSTSTVCSRWSSTRGMAASGCTTPSTLTRTVSPPGSSRFTVRW